MPDMPASGPELAPPSTPESNGHSNGSANGLPKFNTAERGILARIAKLEPKPGEPTDPNKPGLFDVRFGALGATELKALRELLNKRETTRLLGGEGDALTEDDKAIADLLAEKPEGSDPELKFAKDGKIDKEGVRVEAATSVTNAKKAIEAKVQELRSSESVSHILRTLQEQGRTADVAVVEAALDELAAKGTEDAEGWLKDTLQTRGAFDRQIAAKALDYAHDNPDRSNDENYFDALGNRHDQAMAAGVVFKDLQNQVEALKPVTDEEKNEAAYLLAERIKKTHGEFNTPEGRQKVITEGIKVTGPDGSEQTIKFTEDEVVAILENGLVRAEGVTPKNHAEGFRSNEEWDKAVFETATGILESQLVDKITNLAETDVDKKIFEKATEIWKKRTAQPATGTPLPADTGTPEEPDGPVFGPEVPPDAPEDGTDTPAADEDEDNQDTPPTDTPTPSPTPDGGTPPQPDTATPPTNENNPDAAREAAARAEALKKALDELNLQRDAYIKARAATRSFWKNLWGNTKYFFDTNHTTPVQAREALRLEYEMARDKFIKLKAEQAALDKGVAVPEMPAELAADASAEEKAAFDAEKASAEQKRKQYDREVLAQAVNIIALEKYNLSKADYDNMNRPHAVIQALDRLRKNPAVRLAITGGLLASTATGFLPGVAAFGSAQLALSTFGTKAGLDFAAEQYAGRFGNEKKNMSLEQVTKMDQAERDRREAALMEMGIKRGKHEQSNTEVKINDLDQEQVNKQIKEMIDKGEVAGNTSQERAASILKVMLEKRNLNEAIDSKIDKNRNWNARRMLGAMVLAGGATYLINEGFPWGNSTPDASAAEAVKPVAASETFMPWENATGHGYSWKGWAEGEISKFVGVPEDKFPEWAASHPTEYNMARNAVMDAMEKANPGVDFTTDGVLQQSYNRPDGLRRIVEDAIRAGGNAR